MSEQSPPPYASSQSGLGDGTVPSQEVSTQPDPDIRPPEIAQTGHAGESQTATTQTHQPRIGLLKTWAITATLLFVATGGYAIYESGQKTTPAAATSSPITSQQGVAAATEPASEPSTPSPPTVTTPSSEDTTSVSPDDINPSGVFSNAYSEKQHLVVHFSGCGSLNVDVDEPRVNVDSDRADFTAFSACGGNTAPRLEFGTSTAAIGSSPDVTPGDCAEQIRTGALPNDDALPVTKSMTICLTTDQDAARVEGIPWKIAAVVISDIGTDNTISMTVSAWDIPNG